jgi:hypothetical protein
MPVLQLADASDSAANGAAIVNARGSATEPRP